MATHCHPSFLLGQALAALAPFDRHAVAVIAARIRPEDAPGVTRGFTAEVPAAVPRNEAVSTVVGTGGPFGWTATDPIVNQPARKDRP